ncbi:MAG: TonB-dependent receptor, partial [Phenylobacterium sp.]|nr:TonB-dependent receptor [Phenylobacterium sp.]
MGRRSLAGCLAATSVAGVAVIAPPADAQTNAPGGSAGQMLEELVVTARKREESLQRVPVAVSSATGAALESRNIRQPSDLARTVPSLMVQSDNAGSVNTATIILRGQYASDILLNMSQPV